MSANTEPGFQKPKETTELRRVFLVTSGAGAGFGLLASVVLLQTGLSPWSPLPFIAAIILGSGLLSGLAGLGAATLENLLRIWGVKKAPIRLLISFLAVAVLTVAVIFIGFKILGCSDLLANSQRYSLWAAAAGLAFGAVFALISYRSALTRQRMQMLEMENRHLANLASREELLREASRNLAVAEERNRMARELHDSISQGIHGIVYSLRSLRSVVAGAPRGMEILGHLEETADGTLKELRRLVMELTPSPLEDHGLEDALRLHCDLFARRQKMNLHLSLNYAGNLQPDQEVAVYRLTQEVLTNVQKHAEASSVEVYLQSGAETILTIRDNGKGFDVNAVKNGHGLVNMANRARQSGGNLKVVSTPGEGTTVTVKFSAPPPLS